MTNRPRGFAEIRTTLPHQQMASEHIRHRDTPDVDQAREGPQGEKGKGEKDVQPVGPWHIGHESGLGCEGHDGANPRGDAVSGT